MSTYIKNVLWVCLRYDVEISTPEGHREKRVDASWQTVIVTLKVEFVSFWNVSTDSHVAAKKFN